MHPTIPENELEIFCQNMRDAPEFLSPRYVVDAYRAAGLTVLPDPFDNQLGERIAEALANKFPLSVVRISDGEMNLLSFYGYPDTPHLNLFAVERLLDMQQDSIPVSELWISVLRELLVSAIVQADIVGVIGLWPLTPVVTLDPLIAGFLKDDQRGYSGLWRGIDYMLKLARTGLFAGKTIASKHLFFGVIRQLSTIIPRAQRVILITNHIGLKERFATLFPKIPFDLIPVGGGREQFPREGTPQIRPERPGLPIFLRHTEEKLPHDMRGHLCLIGAGIWAEVYCSWVRQRGGVAVDLGSGFDLLQGDTTRPVHRMLGLDRDNTFALERLATTEHSSQP